MSSSSNAATEGEDDSSDEDQQTRPDDARRTIAEENLRRYMADAGHGGRPDFHHRFAVPMYRLPDDGLVGRTFRRLPIADTSSAPTRHLNIPANSSGGGGFIGSVQTPSLGSYSSRSLSTSPDTSVAANTAQSGSPISSAGRLACPYGFLGCHATFNQWSSWDTHCRSHFRGHLPLAITCPFRCDWSGTAATGPEAWLQRNRHISTSHAVPGPVESSWTPSDGLLRHLWRMRLITDAQLREIRTLGSIQDGQTSVQTQNTVRYASRDMERR